MRGIRRVDPRLSGRRLLVGTTEVDIGRRDEQSDPAMAVLAVVPREKRSAERSRGNEVRERVGKSGLVSLRAPKCILRQAATKANKCYGHREL